MTLEKDSESNIVTRPVLLVEKAKNIYKILPLDTTILQFYLDDIDKADRDLIDLGSAPAPSDTRH